MDLKHYEVLQSFSMALRKANLHVLFCAVDAGLLQGGACGERGSRLRMRL